MGDVTDLAVGAVSGGGTVGVVGLLLLGWQRLFSASQHTNKELAAQVNALFAARYADQQTHEQAMTELRGLLHACQERDHHRAMEIEELRAEVQRQAHPSNGQAQ